MTMLLRLAILVKKIIGKISTNFGSQTPHFHQIKIYGTKGTFVHDCGVGNYYFGSEPNEKKEIDKTSFPSTKKGDFIPNFVEAIFFEKNRKLTSKQFMMLCMLLWR